MFNSRKQVNISEMTPSYGVLIHFFAVAFDYEQLSF